MANLTSSPDLSSLAGSDQRLIVVSNRLPVTIKKGKDGEWQFSMSSGGLVSALSGCKKHMKFVWLGWPGEFTTAVSSRCPCRTCLGTEAEKKSVRHTCRTWTVATDSSDDDRLYSD